MTPLSLYQHKMDQGEIRPDSNQSSVIEKLEQIYQALTRSEHKVRWWSLKSSKQPLTEGLYLWGGVGIGKTFLIDCFYETLPLKKMRLHFHQFMHQVHEDLTTVQGVENPLQQIAKNLADKTRVICLDEFLVSNIADAMILAELLQALFSNGVTLITTSNTPPDQLYKDGLQRERFLPAIDLLKKHTAVVHLHTKTDYRKQHIEQAGVYYHPEDEKAHDLMENCFSHFSYDATPSTEPVIICQRSVPIIKAAGTVIWFDFLTICGRPRSQLDYLELTQKYHTVLVSGLRKIEPKEKNLITSLIYLIDILYDAHCRLIISASVSLDKIYPQGPLQDSFQRTLSRLIEMQSEDYVYPGTLDNQQLTPL